MKKLVYFSALVLGLFSCQKEIEYKGEGREPVMVLNAILEVNKTPTIGLTRSVFFLSNNPNSALTEITNANVKLVDLTNSIEYVLVHISSGNYQGTTPILPNTKYKIEISHPDYPTISSEMTTVSEVALTDFNFTNVSGPYGDKLIFDFLFQDPSADNYYGVNLLNKRVETEYDYDSTILSIDTVQQSEYVFSTDVSADFFHSYTSFFKDDLFNGASKTYTCETNFYVPYNVEFESLSWTATLTNLSSELYRYFASIQKNQPNGPFNDPTNVYTNVQNGLGIFGSFASYDKTK